MADVSADYVGDWVDSWSQRAGMRILYSDGVYDVEINWGNSATETSVWSMQGYYDPAQQGIVYENGRYGIETYYAPGPHFDVIYEDGTGLLWIQDGKLYWRDDKEHAGDSCIFERYGDA